MKHILIDYLNVLWATKDVINSLQYGDADLITTTKNCSGGSGSSPTTSSAISSSPNRCQTWLASGLEVMQSIYNNQLQSLNNRLPLSPPT